MQRLDSEQSTHKPHVWISNKKTDKTKEESSEAFHASTQHSTYDLRTTTLPLYFRFEEQHRKKNEDETGEEGS